MKRISTPTIQFSSVKLRTLAVIWIHQFARQSKATHHYVLRHQTSALPLTLCQVATSMQKTMPDTDNPRHYQHNFIIFHKWLTASQLHQKQRKQLARGLEMDAEMPCEFYHSDANHFLWQDIGLASTIVPSYLMA